ncbi:MAG: hypothetical protein WCA20_00105 [Candidatus Sulfotelmatobacter sp.]
MADSTELLHRAETLLGLVPCEECGRSLSLHFDRHCGCKADHLSSDGNAVFLLLRDLRQLRLLAIMEAARG